MRARIGTLLSAALAVSSLLSACAPSAPAPQGYRAPRTPEGTPNTLQRNGIARDSIKIGTEIVVSGYRAKDGRMRANGRDITFPDGRTLFMGSSGTGAPKDGRDPNDKTKPTGPSR